MRNINLNITLILRQAVGSQSSTTAASGKRGGIKVNPLDELAQSGMGMLHLCAALGYDWAVSQLLAGGANIDQQVGRLHLCKADAGTDLRILLGKLPEVTASHLMAAVAITDVQALLVLPQLCAFSFLAWCNIAGCLGASAPAAVFIDICYLAASAACLSIMRQSSAQVPATFWLHGACLRAPPSWHSFSCRTRWATVHCTGQQ